MELSTHYTTADIVLEVGSTSNEWDCGIVAVYGSISVHVYLQKADTA